MKTDDLISALSADTLPRLGPGPRLMRAGPVALALSVAALLMFWGTRWDLAAAMASPAVLKTLVPLALAVLAGALALGLSRPEVQATRRALALGALATGLAAALALAMSGTGVAGLVAALDTPSLAVCLLSVPLLAIPLLGAALWALSSGAPRRPAFTGAVAGIAAGGLSASVYAFYCTEDGALFVLPAYGTAILLVGLAGGIIGARALDW